MKCENIYRAALNILNESEAFGPCDDIDDMEERSTFLIAAFCEEVRELDRSYRWAHGLAQVTPSDRVTLRMDEDFPICSRFVPAAAYYVAAMLILDDNPELSDKLFERYCDSISAISAALPCRTFSTVDVYRD